MLQRFRLRRPRRAVGLAAVCVVGVVSGALGGCASDDDPAQQRRDRVEARLAETFAQDQVDCIMDAIDDTALRALDRTADLDASSAPLLSYTVAVRDCVVGQTPSTTEGAPEASTTTAADG